MSTAAAEVERDQDGQPSLKRVMGPKLLLLFIVGDILGTGVYALTGDVAGKVGGAAWAPFLGAFIVATITALSYLELVTKYPQAAGAALYTHKAFGIHFFTFLVAFAVMCSGITSASTASAAFASFLNDGFDLGLDPNSAGTLVIALGFMILVGLINLRGVGESVKANVLLTLVELSGLLLIIVIGIYAMTQGRADFTEVTVFASEEGKSAFFAVTAATTLAFFAMVGFEDSVNMAEETKDPSRIFPKIMLTGLGITGTIYILVSITAVALVPVDNLTDDNLPEALVQVVGAGAPDLPMDRIFPFIALFAVANSALINMLMASRLLYGLAKQDVLPRFLGRVHEGRRTPYVAIIFTTLIAVGLISYVVLRLDEDAISLLGGTTSLLLLAVFTVVNIVVLVLRRDRVDGPHFTAPMGLPILGALLCAFMTGPWARDEEQLKQYEIAAWLLGVGVVLWLCTWLFNRGARAKKTGFRDPDKIGG